MKNLIAAFIALPLLVSCEVVQQEYYDSGYYNPPPQVEVVRPYRYYQDGRIHRARPRNYYAPRRSGPGVVRPVPRQLPPNVQPARPPVPPPVIGPTERPMVSAPQVQVPRAKPLASNSQGFAPRSSRAPNASASQAKSPLEDAKQKVAQMPLPVSRATVPASPGSSQRPRAIN